MHGAAFALVVNIAVAGLFAASFLIVAVANPTHRTAARRFAASFAIGMLTPVSEFLLPLGWMPGLWMIMSFASLLAGLLAMTAALAAFFGRPPPWRFIACLFAAALAGRLLMWNGPRNWLPYELAYQFPFALAAAASCAVVLRAPGRRPLQGALGVMFALLALHFLAKPFLAVAFGSGDTAADYVASLYALISQAFTGVMLVASGLLILLMLVQSAIVESRTESETDPLSGLANRRGFDMHAARALVEARRLGLPVSVVMFDLDHFKQINDTYGHSIGDQVIRAFAGLLTHAVPDTAVVGRTGGEEFAMVLQRTTVEGARLGAEAVRVATAAGMARGLPPLTVSAGVAAVLPGEELGDLMRRADQALYHAKRTGRDRVCMADEEDKSAAAAGRPGRPRASAYRGGGIE